MKTFDNICEEKAKEGIEVLKEYINGTKDLLYTEEENDGIISIEIECFCNDDCGLTDFVGCWEFDENGELIEEK